jgi:RNA polymerase sigma factor (sigma-70 family)
MNTPDPSGSITVLLARLADGDREAVEGLWARYFPRLVGLARERLRGRPRPVVDEEDVALTAFESFCRRAEEGKFPRLKDRDSLWALLVVMVARKAADAVKHEGRAKRGAGRGPVELPPAGDSAGGLLEPGGGTPTPLEAAIFAEEVETLLGKLDKPEVRQIAVWKLEGHTNEEIARMQGCSVPTVERRLALIRRLLRPESPPGG